MREIWWIPRPKKSAQYKMHLEIMNYYINKLQKIDSEICEQLFCLDRLEEITDIPCVCIHRGAQWSMATGSFSERAGGVVPYVLVVSDGVLCPATSMAVIICIESLAAVMYLRNHLRGWLPKEFLFFVWGGWKGQPDFHVWWCSFPNFLCSCWFISASVCSHPSRSHLMVRSLAPSAWELPSAPKSSHSKTAGQTNYFSV